MTKRAILFCPRVADTDPVVQSRVRGCSDCGAAVWVADSSPAGDRFICTSCSAVFMRAHPNTTIEPPTAQQIRDIDNL